MFGEISASKKKKTPASCDWKAEPDNHRKTNAKHGSRLYKHKGKFSWQGIKIERYKSSGVDWSDIVRQTLIGDYGGSTKFHLRYFEIAPNGHSSFEMHNHEHVVIGIRGNGICVVGDKRYRIGFLDTLYIEPNAPHQLRNPYTKPFGFFCIVNAKRDRPKILGSPKAT